MRILAVLAHCDDEIVVGWPILQPPGKHDVTLLPACRNIRKGDGPMLALQEVCDCNAMSLLECPLNANQFYRLPTRHEEFTLMSAVTVIESATAKAIEQVKSDAIFTHNPWGEYGHGDHRLLFNIVARMNYPMILTDICLRNACHPSSDEIPQFYRPLFQGPIEHCSLDGDEYECMKRIYEKHNAWTWGGHEPVREAGLYLFGKGV